MPDIHSFEPIWPNWVIDEVIGRGSFGTVYKAHREDRYAKISQNAAVKHISIPGEMSEEDMDGLSKSTVQKYYRGLLNQLVKEIKAMVELRGTPHIVAYEEHRIVEKPEGAGYDLFLRMELLTGLPDYVRACDGLNRDEVIKLGIHIARALETLQAEKFIHRDIKPQNIFIDRRGSFKLGDFGTARVLQGEGAASTRAGTPNYMAPEVYSGSTHYDQTVDIYSLGIVLYRYMNNGLLPFVNEQAVDPQIAILKRIEGRPLPPPCQADEALSKIILKACAFKPEDRYQTAADMRKALEELKDNIVQPITYTVSVECVLEGNSQILRSSTEVCLAGSSCTIAAPYMEGYEVTGEKSIRVDVDPQGNSSHDKIRFSYRRDTGNDTVITNAEVPIVCVTEDGKDLSRSVQVCLSGEENLIHAPKQEGYRLISRSPVTVKVEKNGKAVPPTVTFVWRKVESKKSMTIVLVGMIVVLAIAAALLIVKPWTSTPKPLQKTDQPTAAAQAVTPEPVSTATLTPISTPTPSPSPTPTPTLTPTLPPPPTPTPTSAPTPTPSPTSTPTPTPTSAPERREVAKGTYGDYKYTIYDDGIEKVVSIDEYNGTASSVRIPDLINNIRVSVIGNHAFSLRKSLSSVQIPESVTHIGDGAFSDCSSLSSVQIPDSVISIGNYAFSWCNTLSAVQIPDGVISIGHSAFGHCENLSQLHIPYNLTRIEGNPFAGISLITLSISSDHPRLIYQNGLLIEKDSQRLIAFIPGYQQSECIVPNGIRSIGNVAFEGCKFLSSVQVTNGVTSIGDYAFLGCESLSSMDIPDTVTSIGYYTFAKCDQLTLNVFHGSYAEQYAKENNIPYRIK